jgi:hypothetical protein
MKDRGWPLKTLINEHRDDLRMKEEERARRLAKELDRSERWVNSRLRAIAKTQGRDHPQVIIIGWDARAKILTAGWVLSVLSGLYALSILNNAFMSFICWGLAIACGVALLVYQYSLEDDDEPDPPRD